MCDGLIPLMYFMFEKFSQLEILGTILRFILVLTEILSNNPIVVTGAVIGKCIIAKYPAPSHRYEACKLHTLYNSIVITY